MSKKQFEKDLKKGEEVERKLTKYIKKKYPKAYKIEGENKDADIVIPETEETIEVKNDMGSSDTPNYFIETSCNYESSGITSTKADYWAIYDEVDVIWIKTSKLKALCLLMGKEWIGYPSGCNSQVEAFLIPQNILKEHAELIRKGEIYGL